MIYELKRQISAETNNVKLFVERIFVIINAQFFNLKSFSVLYRRPSERVYCRSLA